VNVVEKTGTLHRVWFPLRSNATYFEGPRHSLDLEARIKQAALLCEELVFEFGMLDVTVTEHGMWSFWIPPNQLSEGDIIRRRDATAKGGAVHLAVGTEVAPGVPADPQTMHTMMSGSLQEAFVAEYHLLLRETGLDEAEWVKWAAPPPDSIEYAKQLGQEQSRLEGIDLGYSTLPTLSKNSFLDKQLKKDLNFDLALAGLMRVPAAIDEIRRPLLIHKASDPEAETSRQAPGALALHALAPDFTAFPWCDVIALHDHDAIAELRAKLVEFEEAVADRPEEEHAEAIADLALDASLRKASKTVGGTAKEVVIDVATGFLPVVGKFASAVTGVAKIQRAREEQRQDWAALLLKLRQPTREKNAERR
jgi:hypothetical protein